jgi:DNA topoisomerase 2-associated protein PAT1
MSLVAQQNRLQGTSSRQHQHQQHQLVQEMRLRQQQEEERYMLQMAQHKDVARRPFYESDSRVSEFDQHSLEQEQRRILQERRLWLEEKQRRTQEQELERQRIFQLQEQQRLQQLMQQQQQQQQRTPPPRMLPVSQSPRFFEHQRQLLQLQQQQQQEQVQMEELQRQLLNNLTLQQQGSVDSRRRLAGPTDYEIQAAQLLHQQQQQQRRQARSQSPTLNHFNSVPQDVAPQNIQLQQRLLSEMAQAEFLREMQATTPKQLEQQEALRAEAMRKIIEAEKMEEKRRRKAAKIAHMVK